jgi:hypothetical protein
MFRKLKVIIAIFSLLLVPASFAAAKTSVDQPLNSGPSGSYATEIFCTNVGSSATTTIQINFYGSDSSTVVLSYSDTTALAAGTSRSYFTPSLSPSLPNPFIGSAVVSADQPLECSVNSELVDPNVGTTSVPARFSTVEGVDSSHVSTTLYAPQLDKALSGWNSYFAIQNTEQTDITVNVSYVDRFGTAYPSANESVLIPAQSNHVFYPENNANLPSNFLGGVTVTSTGMMAGMVTIYNADTDYTTSQFQSYPFFSSGANKLWVPNFVRNYYGYNTGLSVQNVGTASTTFTVTFSFAGSTYVYTSGTVVPGATVALYAPNISQLAPVDSLGVSSRTGSAIVQAAAGGSIVANINKDNRGVCTTGVNCGTITPNWVGQAVTFEAIPDGTQTDTVYFVQVASHVGSGDWSGGYAYANTTDTATTCTVSFPSASAANQTGVALAANGSNSIFAPNVPSLPSGYNGSVIVTCGQPILGTSNISARNTAYYGDSNGQSNGFNK